MASKENIVDEIISQHALEGFDALNTKLLAVISSVEKLIATGVDLNNQYSKASTFKAANEGAEKLAASEKALADNTKILTEINDKLAAAIVAASKAKTTNTNTTKAQVTALAEEKGALAENIKIQLEYTNRLKQITEEIKKNKKAYQDGTVSAEQYKINLVSLNKEQSQLKNTLSVVNATIKQQVKEEQAALGSVNQLKAKLDLLTKAYDNLGKSQRNSNVGKDVKKQLNEVTSELSKLEQGTGRFQRNVGNYKSAFDGISAALGPIAAALIGLGSIKELFSSIIEEAEQAEASQSRFANTLKNLGKSDSLDRLNAAAVKLAATYGYLDNDDVVDVFQKLTIYGKLTENQIKSLTPVIIDFAAQQRISLTEATDVFTKALEGSGKALKTYGINIKDGANVTERFGILMTDLKGKVDGAAVAFGETLAGQVAVSTQALKDLEEEVGKELIPIWSKLKVVAVQGLMGIIQAVEQVAFTVKTAYRSIFDKKALEEDLAKAQILQQVNQANAFAVSYIAGLKDKSTKGLEKELQTSQAILQTIKDYAAQATKLGGATKEQNKQRAQQVLNNTAIVEGLKTEIRLSKEKIKTADDDKSHTKVKQFTEKTDDSVAKHFIELEKQVSDNLDVQLQQRLDLRQQAYSEEYGLLLQASEREKKVEKDKLDTALSGKTNVTERLNALNEYNNNVKGIENKFDADQILQQLAFVSNYDRIITTSRAKRLSDEQADNKLFADAALTAQTAKFKAADDANKVGQSHLAEGRDILLADLDRNRQVNIKNQEKQEDADQAYAHHRLKIETDYLADSTILNIEYFENLLKIKKQTRAQSPEEKEEQTKEIATLEAQIAALKAQLAAAQQARRKDTKTTADQELKDLLDTFDKIQRVANAITDAIGGAINASITAQKNALKDQSDQIDKNAQQEIEAVNASLDTEEKKAARIQIINARTQAQKEAIDRRQRQLDQQKAVFEKAKAIFDIIIGTAIAVATAKTPFEKIFNAASGAAQLAVAIATPIPKFAEGTLDAPGGLAMVGDAHRSEMVVTPDGRLIETPSSPTVMNVPAHSIILPDARAAMEAGVGNGGRVPTTSEAREIFAMLTGTLGDKIDRLTRTVANKQEWHLYPKKDGWERIKRGPGGSTHYIGQ